MALYSKKIIRKSRFFLIKILETYEILKFHNFQVLANSSELSLSEEKSIKDGRVFLPRNRRKTIERAMKHGVPQEFIDNFGAKPCSPAALRQIVIGLLYRYFS